MQKLSIMLFAIGLCLLIAAGVLSSQWYANAEDGTPGQSAVSQSDETAPEQLAQGDPPATPAEPAASEPETAEPETAEPDTSEPDTSEADTSESDTSESGTSEPGTRGPDSPQTAAQDDQPQTARQSASEQSAMQPSEPSSTQPQADQAEPTTAPSEETQAQVADAADSAANPATDDESDAAQTQPTPEPPPEPAFTFAEPKNPKGVSIGSAEGPDGPHRLQVQLTKWGAGVRQIRLASYKEDVEAEQFGYTIMPSPVLPAQGERGKLELVPFAMRSLTINGERLELMQLSEWDLIDHTPERATYGLRVLDDQGRPALEIRRRYVIEPDTYDLQCVQRLINLSDKPLKLTWEQNLQADVRKDAAMYIGDRRQYTVGYYNPSYDQLRRFVYTSGGSVNRMGFLNEQPQRSDFYRPYRYSPVFESDLKPLWPNPDVPEGAELVWLAATNRYFALVLHGPIGPAPQQTDAHAKVVPLRQRFADLRIQVIGHGGAKPDQDTRQGMFYGISHPIELAPRGESGDRASMDLSLFAGPLKKDLLQSHPASALHLDGLLVYSLGCTFCTFQWLARFLLNFLELLHDYVFFDWGLAIIVLVAVVRVLLHPITRQSQMQMTIFSEKMQSIQPELEKLKKKHVDDPQKFQQEQIRLMQEKGVSPFGCLGILPMFLQMPIWVALYAMLFYAIELRHQPAFYGVFQAFGDWAFLRDLASPDHFWMVWSEADPLVLNLVFTEFHLTGLNILPILWAVLMFINQKLMSPPATTEQMAQQQKMMQFMTFLFPLFLYNAPSGLTLYIMASTVAGIVDSYLVKQHIKKLKDAGELHKPKKPKEGGGMMQKLSQWYEEKQKQVAELQGEDPKQGAGRMPGQPRGPVKPRPDTKLEKRAQKNRGKRKR